jgi:hypothetical protein
MNSKNFNTLSISDLSAEDRELLYKIEHEKVKTKSRAKIKKVLKAAGVGLVAGAAVGATAGFAGAAGLVFGAPLTVASIPAIGETMTLGGAIVGGSVGSISKGGIERSKIDLQEQNEKAEQQRDGKIRELEAELKNINHKLIDALAQKSAPARTPAPAPRPKPEPKPESENQPPELKQAA